MLPYTLFFSLLKFIWNQTHVKKDDEKSKYFINIVTSVTLKFLMAVFIIWFIQNQSFDFPPINKV